MPGSFTLDTLLSPYSRSEFLNTVWGKKCLYVSGQQEKYRSLFSWDDLNRILEQVRLEPPRLRLEREGSSATDIQFLQYRTARRGGNVPRLDIPRFYEHLQNGATLVLDAVDEFCPAISATCESLTATLGSHLQVNMYASWGSTRGFGLHWDDHDVFVTHLEGHKRWLIYRPTREFPLYRDITPNLEKPTEPIAEYDVGPGDLLYLPRGHWHDVIGRNEPTLHLTFGITNPTGIDLLGWLADELRDEAVFRADLPQFASAEDVLSHEELLKAAFLEVFQTNLIRRFFSDRRSKLGPRAHLSLPFGAGQAFGEFVGQNLLVCLSCMTFEVDRSETTICVRASGKEWTFPEAAAQLVESLLARKPVRVKELLLLVPEGLRASVPPLLEAFLHEGLIYVVSEDRGAVE